MNYQLSLVYNVRNICVGGFKNLCSHTLDPEGLADFRRCTVGAFEKFVWSQKFNVPTRSDPTGRRIFSQMHHWVRSRFSAKPSRLASFGASRPCQRAALVQGFGWGVRSPLCNSLLQVARPRAWRLVRRLPPTLQESRLRRQPRHRRRGAAFRAPTKLCLRS